MSSTESAPKAKKPGRFYLWITGFFALCLIFGLNPTKLRSYFAKRMPQDLTDPAPAPKLTSTEPSTESDSANYVPQPQTRGITNTETYRQIKVNMAAGEYEFQLDARVLKQSTPAIVTDGDQVEYWVSGRVCPVNPDPCVGPNGQGGRPIDVDPSIRQQWKVDEFPVKDAYFQAAVSYIDSKSFQIGDHRIWPVPAGTGNQHIVLGTNIRDTEVGRATGGFRVRIKITHN